MVIHSWLSLDHEPIMGVPFKVLLASESELNRTHPGSNFNQNITWL